MKSSLRTKFFALSITALFVAQPATANYSTALLDTGKRFATAVVLSGLGWKVQSLLNEHVYKPYIYKRNGVEKHDDLMSDAQDDSMGVPLALASNAAQAYGYMNDTASLAFTTGWYSVSSAKDLYNNRMQPELSQDYAKKLAAASIWAASGFFRTYFSKLVNKHGNYGALFDFVARTPMAALTLRFLEFANLDKALNLKTGRALSDLTKTGIDLGKTAGFDIPSNIHNRTTNLLSIFG